MALSNPFKVTYGSRAVGGDASSTGYQIDGVHLLEKTNDELRLVFTVLVAESSYADLETKSQALLDDFRKRDQNLTLDFDAIANPGVSTQTYTFGSTALQTVSGISKSGNDQTDRGYSRAYVVTISAGLPPSDNSEGLRSIEVTVTKEAGNQTIITLQGEYVAADSQHAYDQYLDNIDAEFTAYKAIIKSGATFELVSQDVALSREKNPAAFPHVCTFNRQYVELLYQQTQVSLDDSEVKSHDLTFTDTSQHPGEGAEAILRMRRVAAAFNCFLDIDQSTDLQTLWQNKIRPFLAAQFVSTFSPSEYGVESSRVGYNETRKMLTAQLVYIYIPSGADDIVEASYIVGYKEQQDIDYTHVHDGGVFSKYADQGFASRQRIQMKTELAVGAVSASRRIGGSSPGGGTTFNFRTGAPGGSNSRGGQLGGGTGSVGGSSLGGRRLRPGWNLIHSNSSTESRWIGDPSLGPQIQLSLLTDTIIHEWNEEPRG